MDGEKMGNHKHLSPQVHAEYLGRFRPFLANSVAEALLPVRGRGVDNFLPW